MRELCIYAYTNNWDGGVYIVKKFDHKEFMCFLRNEIPTPKMPEQKVQYDMLFSAARNLRPYEYKDVLNDINIAITFQEI